MRVRATVAYDGTGYGGFQHQDNAPSIQDALEGALARVTQETSRVTAAGRTDAGVHAEGQVVAFETRWRHGLGGLQRALNAVLPVDVAVAGLAEVADGFHPRFDARSRWYRYTLYNAPVRSPLAWRYSLHVPELLDGERMAEAAGLLVGTHDFATFGQPTQGDVTIRRVLRAEWHGSGPWRRFDIEANAFLYRMVRSIVGTLLLVGRGALSVAEFERRLAACERSQSGPTAAPQGLCLMGVTYE